MDAPAPASRTPELALVAITVVWGATFLVTQWGLRDAGPFGFLAVRLAIASLLLIAVSGRHLGGLTRQEAGYGAILAVGVVGGLGLQSAGLATIESSKSAFLTALYVPLVPLIEWALLRRRVPGTAWLGAALAFAGLVGLAGGGASLSLDLGRGEALTVASAVISAFAIIATSHFALASDPRRQAAAQLVVGTAFAAAVAWATGEALPRPTPGFLACVAGLGVASAVIQTGMNWAQRTVPAARATLIYALEPVWAGLFGWLAGERLGTGPLVGAGLILLSLVVSAWRLPAHRSVGRMLAGLRERLTAGRAAP